MRAFVDPVGGIAGDMLVAALVDAGASLELVLAEVRKLGVEGWSARVEPAWRGPFAATRFVVDVGGDGHDHAHGHDHGHDHDGHSRRWADIRALLEGSTLGEGVKRRALATFAVLAEAEGRVHGMPAEAVAFHEVGAVDSIVDIVAAAAALDLLGIDEIVVGPLPLGSGSVVGAHGLIPLPAPATVECLRGFVVEGIAARGETVTPTGAALVAALMRPGAMPSMRVLRSGTGAGTWDPASHPNVVRVIVGEGDAGAVAEVLELRAEVDGLTGEAVPPLLDALFAAGAIDAYVTPVLMKKGRPGLLVTALCAPPEARAVGDALLRHGRTLGYRTTRCAREVLARRHEVVATKFGDVRLKIGEREGAILHLAPEYEDCARQAAAAGVPVVEVMGAALLAWSARPRGSYSP